MKILPNANQINNKDEFIKFFKRNENKLLFKFKEIFNKPYLEFDEVDDNEDNGVAYDGIQVKTNVEILGYNYLNLYYIQNLDIKDSRIQYIKFKGIDIGYL